MKGTTPLPKAESLNGQCIMLHLQGHISVEMSYFKALALAFALRSSLGIRDNVHPDAGLNHEADHVIPVQLYGVDLAHL